MDVPNVNINLLPTLFRLNPKHSFNSAGAIQYGAFEIGTVPGSSSIVKSTPLGGDSPGRNICLPHRIVGITKGKYWYKLGEFVSMMLRLFIAMLQKSLSPLLSKEPEPESFDEEFEAAVTVPKDVEEGHFVVFAADGDERKRFVINLELLSNPSFLRLLELAKEEYGFQQKGALTIPCRPEELQRIVEDRRKQKNGKWIASSVHVITTY